MNTVSHRLRAVVSVGCLVIGLTFVSTALAANNELCKGYCSNTACKPKLNELCCCCEIGIPLTWTCVSRSPTDCNKANGCQTD